MTLHLELPPTLWHTLAQNVPPQFVPLHSCIADLLELLQANTSTTT